MSRKNWKDTDIWNRLKSIDSEESDHIKAFLASSDVMDKIELILDKGSTSPKDFTLHDSDHSFRVAQRMWEIVPVKTKEILSEYELILMLMAAYLHDIGMTPEFNKVDRHLKYLISIDKSNILSDEEFVLFQKWFDDYGEVLDIKDSVIEFENATEWVTYFCRAMHNDWSEAWIRDNFSGKQVGRFANWMENLILVCKSHHYGLEELKKSVYDPYRIHDKAIHLRYISMCLRTADVIEIDPERAPKVLMKHRSIISGSMSHWIKEQISSVEIRNNSVTVTARPSQAYIHKTILDVCDYIEKETTLCNILKVEKPLNYIFSSNDLGHEWNLLPQVLNQVVENGNYEYIEGTFRPKVDKILELLAGTELYERPIYAVRELLQNAMDACKIQLAYLIRKNKKYSTEIENQLMNLFYVEIKLEKDQEGVFLIIRDNGCGMDKSIINSSFLVGGASRRTDLIELERECKRLGYDLSLTSRFGIGVLSYFMISDSIVLETKRSLESGVYDSMGFQFKINGLSNFGELRRVDYDGNGTIVKLKLKKQFIENSLDKEVFVDFIKKTATNIKSRLKLVWEDELLLDQNPGWTFTDDDLKELISFNFSRKIAVAQESSEEFLSQDIKERHELFESRIEFHKRRMLERLKIKTLEGNLVNTEGKFRVQIPFFENQNGTSPVYFFESNEDPSIIELIGNNIFFAPRFDSPKLSWKGIAVQSRRGYGIEVGLLNSAYIEIDLCDEKNFEIGVSRLILTEKDRSFKLNSELKDIILKMIETILPLFKDGIYSYFNSRIFKQLKVNANSAYWILDYDYKELTCKFEPIKFPISNRRDIGIARFTEYLGQKVHYLDPISGIGMDTYSSSSVSFGIKKFRMSKIIFYQRYSYKEFQGIYLDSLIEENPYNFLTDIAEFPPDWSDLLLVNADYNYYILNSEHPALKLLTEENYEFADLFLKSKESVNSEHGLRFLEDKSKAFCLILRLIIKGEMPKWTSLVQSSPEYVNQLWSSAFDDINYVLKFHYTNVHSDSIVNLSNKGSDQINSKKEVRDIMPDPDDTWIGKSSED